MVFLNIDCYRILTQTAPHNLQIVKYLTSSVDVNIDNSNGHTPLQTACEYGQLDIVKFLVSLPSVDVHIKIRISNYSALLHKAC